VVFPERAGLDRTHIYRIESGRQSMTLRTLKTFADTALIAKDSIF
jgi:hypothetical protein